jgi:RNA-directed DNA polymerase
MLHPEKMKIVYCKDANRRGDFPHIRFDFLGFQFQARKTMWTVKGKRIFTHGFLSAASSESIVRAGRESAAGRCITAATNP